MPCLLRWELLAQLGCPHFKLSHFLPAQSSFIYLYITTAGKDVQCQYQLLDLTPVHYQKYYFPRICLFLSLFPVALEAQENCFTCGLVSVKESDRRGQKGPNLASIQPKTYWPVIVSFSYLDIVQALQCPHSLPVFSYWHSFSRSWVNFVCNSGPEVTIHISILCLVKIISVTWKMFSGSSSSLLFFQEMHSFLRHALDLIQVILFPDIAGFLLIV